MKTKLHFTLLCLSVLLASGLSSATAGEWKRTAIDTETCSQASTPAEILLLKDGRLTVNEGIERLQIPIKFRDAQQKALASFPKLQPGEESNVYTFILYSTADYEGTEYATVSTVICVPDKTLEPFQWEPAGFENRTPSGIGDVNEDPRYHLYNMMTTTDSGETVRMLPKHINSNNDKPWSDYKLWVYKDYSKAYPMAQLRRVFNAHHSGEAVAFKSTLDLKETRGKGYVYPSTIDESSIVVKVANNMDLEVALNDRTAAEVSGSVTYEYFIEQLMSNIYWNEVANGTVKGKSGQKAQLLKINGSSLNEDKKHRIRLKAKWSGFSDDHEIAEAVHGFATIAGTVTGRDEDEDSDPHNFDDIIFQGGN